MSALPGVFRHQCRTGDEIGQRRGVSRRRLGALACPQIELGQPFAFLAWGEQGSAEVELADDLEDVVLDRLRRRPRGEQPADPQVLGSLLTRGDKRVYRLLVALVREAVGPLM